MFAAADLQSLGLTLGQVLACRATYVEGEPTRDTAARFGARSADAIRMRRLRARRKLAASADPAVRRLAAALDLSHGNRRTVRSWSILPNDA